MAYTRVNLRRDVPDVGGNVDGAPGLEFRVARDALGIEHSGRPVQHVPANVRFRYGHAHARQEEAFVVIGAPRLSDDPRDDVASARDWWPAGG